MSDTLEGYRTTQVQQYARCTYRQLDYWARTDLLSPSILETNGSGTYRLYSANDVRIARAFAALSEAGMGGHGSKRGTRARQMFKFVAGHIKKHGLTGTVSCARGLIVIDLGALSDPL